jgi:nicotinamide phosphoribosyltransferase
MLMSDFDENICCMTDSYKASHYKQYPAGTRRVYSYFESRGGRYPLVTFFGLQYYLKKYLQGQVVTQEKIDEADELFGLHFGKKGVFNRKGWEYILKTHGGRLPVHVRAVPEGSVIPTHNVLMDIENTDNDNTYWLTNWLETLLVQVWYGSTVATQSREMKKTLLKHLGETGDPGLIDFKLHDFGYRGVSSVETAAVGGAAHLLNFLGTDTFAGVMLARKYYNEPMAGFSIPASEHSTITSWGSEHELEAMRNMLTQYPDGLVACVSDSFDIERACRDYWGTELREQILARDGVLVVRPDSGDPATMVIKVLKILADKFGGETNNRGFFVLNPKVRVIQGDGIDHDSLDAILNHMTEAKFSADNLAFGSGGGLLQKLNRDTQKFAFKCSNVTVNGEDRDVYKDPVTDPGKKSKRGRLALIQSEGAHGKGWKTVRQSELPTESQDLLCSVFKDGELLVDHTFAECRERSAVRAVWF